jgi:hypothetical protein
MASHLSELRQSKAKLIDICDGLQSSRDKLTEVIMSLKVQIADVDHEIQVELERVRPVNRGQAIAIEFVGNPDD